MPRLTRRQLFTYAVVSQEVYGLTDLLSGLLPFFQPLMQDMVGKVFDPVAVASRVEETYGWPVSTDVIYEMIPRFEQAGWVERIAQSHEEAAYICKQIQPEEISAEHTEDIEATLNELGKAFKGLIEEISPLIKRNYSEDDLVDIFLNWLVSVEGFERVELIRMADGFLREVDDTVPHQFIRGTQLLDSEDSYLCARFVEYLSEINSTVFEKVINIASVALLTEVVLDFRDPPEAGRVERELMVLLDGPFVMDALGISGKERQANAKVILNSLAQMQCRLAVFAHSCDEVRDNLRAVLDETPGRRFGPTADALRKSELQEDYARGVLADVEYFAREQCHLQIIDQSLDQFPNQHHYFPIEFYEDFVARARWHERMIPRERDAKSVALIMRRRAGYRTRDPLSSKFILVTRNRLFSEFSRRFCLEHEVIKDQQTGPIIHQRRLASLLWLTLGSSEKRELTRRQLMVACERVLRTRPALIEKARQKLSEVDESAIPQLEALLTKPRSTQLLLDLTLNVEEVITADNIKQILELMRRTTAEDIEKEAKERISKVTRRSRERIAELAAKKTATEIHLSEAEGRVEAARERDRTMLKNWACDAKKFQKRALFFQKIAFILLAIVLGAGSLVLSLDAFPTLKRILAVCVALLMMCLTIFPVFDRFPNVIKPWVERRRDEILWRRARVSGRMDLTTEYQVDWETLEISDRAAKPARPCANLLDES